MKKILASTTVAASLLGGGVAGITLLAPTVATAQDEVVVEPADDSRPEPGEKLAEVLAPLVDDGTLTQAQADAVTGALLEARPERGLGHGHGFRGGFEVISELLDMEPSEIGDALRDGQTLADLAEANGSSAEALIDALVADANEHIDAALESDRINEDEAEERRANVVERITDLVNGELERGDGPRGFGPRGPRGGGFGESGPGAPTD